MLKVVKSHIFIATISIWTLLVTSPTIALALPAEDSASRPNPTFQIAKPPNIIGNIPGLISWAIQIMFLVAGLITFVYLLLGGIKWITSGGDKGNVEKARNQIVQALIGLVVVFAAWGIIVLVENLTGIGLGFSKSISLPGSDILRAQ